MSLYPAFEITDNRTKSIYDFIKRFIETSDIKDEHGNPIDKSVIKMIDICEKYCPGISCLLKPIEYIPIEIQEKYEWFVNLNIHGPNKIYQNMYIKCYNFDGYLPPFDTIFQYFIRKEYYYVIYKKNIIEKIQESFRKELNIRNRTKFDMKFVENKINSFQDKHVNCNNNLLVAGRPIQNNSIEYVSKKDFDMLKDEHNDLKKKYELLEKKVNDMNKLFNNIFN